MAYTRFLNTRGNPSMSANMRRAATLRRVRGSAVLLALLWCSDPVLAQPAPPSAAAAGEQLQARVGEVARALQANPRLKKQKEREDLVEFVTGNMLFVLLHEMAHASVDGFQLLVLGREEDAADDFAILRLLKVGSAFTHRILVNAAKGWFLSDKRDRKDGEPLAYYDEHGLDKQRAYQIVCLMVGSNPHEFKDLANETKLPEDRQASCETKDYPRISRSWEEALKAHLRDAERPKSQITVAYEDGKGDLDTYAQAFRTLRLLEIVATAATEQLSWPGPLDLKMKSCGVINAAWVQEDHTLTMCYELAADFAELYRDFNKAPVASPKRKSKSK